VHCAVIYLAERTNGRAYVQCCVRQSFSIASIIIAIAWLLVYIDTVFEKPSAHYSRRRERNGKRKTGSSCGLASIHTKVLRIVIRTLHVTVAF